MLMANAIACWALQMTAGQATGKRRCQAREAGDAETVEHRCGDGREAQLSPVHSEGERKRSKVVRALHRALGASGHEVAELEQLASQLDQHVPRACTGELVTGAGCIDRALRGPRTHQPGQGSVPQVARRAHPGSLTSHDARQWSSRQLMLGRRLQNPPRKGVPLRRPAAAIRTLYVGRAHPPLLQPFLWKRPRAPRTAKLSRSSKYSSGPNSYLAFPAYLSDFASVCKDAVFTVSLDFLVNYWKILKTNLLVLLRLKSYIGICNKIQL